MRLDAMLPALLLLAACAHAPPSSPPGPSPAADVAPDGGMGQAVSFSRHLQALNRDELRAEYLRVAKTFAQAPTVEARIQLILLLSHPRADDRDLDAALALISEYLAGAGPGPLTNLFRLLEAGVQAQRGYEDDIRQAHQRNEQLQQQLDGLRSIERAIHARELPEPAK